MTVPKTQSSQQTGSTFHFDHPFLFFQSSQLCTALVNRKGRWSWLNNCFPEAIGQSRSWSIAGVDFVRSESAKVGSASHPCFVLQRRTSKAHLRFSQGSNNDNDFNHLVHTVNIWLLRGYEPRPLDTPAQLSLCIVPDPWSEMKITLQSKWYHWMPSKGELYLFSWWHSACLKHL